MSPATLAWLSAFCFTQAVEIPIYVVAIRRARDRDDAREPDLPELPAWAETAPARIAAAFGASLVTHPIVWFLIPRLPLGSYGAMIVFAETFAVVAEGFYFAALGLAPLRRAMLWALVANVTSASLGLASRHVLGWP